MVRAARRTKPPRVANVAIAAALSETADLLEQQGANPYRVRAYREGAATVRRTARPLSEVLAEQGVRELTKLRGIGDSLAQAIEKIVTSQRLPLLERLREESAPEQIFTTVADIGPKLAERIHHALGIETLAELEAASWDGRLARVPGMGQKRVRAVRESLAGRFGNRPNLKRETAPPLADEPSVGELIDIDREYRDLAARDRLMRIAPRRFNPEGKAWLPILHTEREGRRYTALYSNTSRAHELGALRDWVVIYRDEKAHAGTWTVITSRVGRMKGRRVVRGREQECQAWYDSKPTQLRLIPIPDA